MKVNTLIQILSRMDPNAEVRMVMQPNYPLEFTLAGVALRQNCTDDEPRPESGRALSDVLLVEGSQDGYGSRQAWDEVQKA